MGHHHGSIVFSCFLLPLGLNLALAPDGSSWIEFVLEVQPSVHLCLGEGKCYNSMESGCTKTCRKVGHSCLRGIASFVNFPGRESLRFACRAIAFVIKECWETVEITDMSQAPSQQEQAFSQLTPARADRCCSMCQTCMHGPSAHVADAAQAFEAMAESRVMQAATSLFKQSEKCPNPIPSRSTVPRR